MEDNKTTIADLFGITNLEDHFVTNATVSNETKEQESDVEQEDNSNVEEDPAGQGQKVEKEQAEEPASDIEKIIQSLHEKGTFLVDSEKEYDMSVEGLENLIKETKTRAEDTALERLISNSKDPRAKDVIEHFRNGGTLDDFQAPISYESVHLYEHNGDPIEHNMIEIVRDWMVSEGYSEEDIEEDIDLHRKNGTLNKLSESCQKKLINLEKKQAVELAKEREAREKLEEERNQLEIEKFKNKVVNTTKLAGFDIAKQDAEALYNFITKTDKKGLTEFAKKDNDEHRLFYAYMVMKGFDLNDIKTKIATTQAVTLKKKLNSYSDSNMSGKRSSGDPVQKTDNSVRDIKWII